MGVAKGERRVGGGWEGAKRERKVRGSRGGGGEGRRGLRGRDLKEAERERRMEVVEGGMRMKGGRGGWEGAAGKRYREKDEG